MKKNINQNSSIKYKVQPLVSIVMPVYNSMLTIMGTLESIQNQTYDNLELVFIDGGSCDSTVEVIFKFFPNAKVFNQSGAGIWDAINQGIINANGDYIFSLNSDDLISIYAIEDLIRTAEDSCLDAVWLPTYSAGGYKSKIKINLSWLGMDRVFPGHSASFLVKKSIHKEMGLYDPAIMYCADHHFFHKLMASSKSLGSIHSNRRAFGIFTQGGFSLSNSYISKAAEEFQFRYPHALIDVNDFIYCFMVYPLKCLWHVKKKLNSILS